MVDLLEAPAERVEQGGVRKARVALQRRRSLSPRFRHRRRRRRVDCLTRARSSYHGLLQKPLSLQKCRNVGSQNVSQHTVTSSRSGLRIGVRCDAVVISSATFFASVHLAVTTTRFCETRPYYLLQPL